MSDTFDRILVRFAELKTNSVTRKREVPVEREEQHSDGELIDRFIQLGE